MISSFLCVLQTEIFKFEAHKLNSFSIEITTFCNFCRYDYHMNQSYKEKNGRKAANSYELDNAHSLAWNYSPTELRDFGSFLCPN